MRSSTDRDWAPAGPLPGSDERGLALQLEIQHEPKAGLYGREVAFGQLTHPLGEKRAVDRNDLGNVSDGSTWQSRGPAVQCDVARCPGEFEVRGQGHRDDRVDSTSIECVGLNEGSSGWIRITMTGLTVQIKGAPFQPFLK